MRITSEINDAINAQIMRELKNNNKYLQISSYFRNLELNNLAKYFLEQADGEYGHAKKFMDYLNSRVGGKVTIGAVEDIGIVINSATDVGDLYLAAEEETTKNIEAIMDIIREQKSYIDEPLINSMLSEQVEEEDSALDFAIKIKNTKDLVIFDATFESGD